jgi:hypothetical protein
MIISLSRRRSWAQFPLVGRINAELQADLLAELGARNSDQTTNVDRRARIRCKKLIKL